MRVSLIELCHKWDVWKGDLQQQPIRSFYENQISYSMLFSTKTAVVSILVVTFIFAILFNIIIIFTNMLPIFRFSSLITSHPINYLCEKYFHKTMTATEKTEMLNLLKIFKFQMEKFHITYMLYAGSLIGAHRHHGMIPWDDDIDILIDSNDKAKLKLAINELNRTHSLKDYDGNETSKWKFYKLNGKYLETKPFRYPYLDLFFLKEFNQSMYHVETELILFPKLSMFPTILKEFDGIALPTPCNTLDILNTMYGSIKDCSSPKWNHSMEHPVHYFHQISVNCNILRPFFPFTERTIERLPDRINVKEQLLVGRITLQQVQYSTPLSCSGIHSYFDSNLSTLRL